jgi:hypothetical protein
MQQVQRRRRIELGKAQHYAVIGGLDLHVRAWRLFRSRNETRQLFTEALRECHAPRRIHASAEWGVQYDPNASGFVAEVLRDQSALVGNDARNCTLGVSVLHE